MLRDQEFMVEVIWADMNGRQCEILRLKIKNCEDFNTKRFFRIVVEMLEIKTVQITGKSKKNLKRAKKIIFR